MSFRYDLSRGVRIAAVLLLATPAAVAAQTTFTRITAGNPIVTDLVPSSSMYTGCAWVDFDMDGDQDLYIVQQGLFRNDGGGSFTKLATIPRDHTRAIGCSWADFDNDGDPDLYVSGGPQVPGGPVAGGSMLYRNDGGGAFTPLTEGVIGNTVANQGWGCAWGDYDVDGRADLVVAAAAGFAGITTPNHLLHNDGGEAFTSVDTSVVCAANGPYTTATWNDADDDGDPDLFIAAGPVNGVLTPDFVYENLRTAPGQTVFRRDVTSAPATDGHDGQLFNWVDIDADGDLDCYLTNYGGRGGLANVMYRNDGGTFVAMTGVEAGTIVTEVDLSLASVWADFDNDGDLDAMVTNDASDPTRYYDNDGHGFFTEVVPSAVRLAGPHFGAAAADLDQDGDVDLYVHGPSARRGLFLNDLASPHGWLEVRCVGTQSNRSALGARVWVRAMIGGQPRRLVQQVSAQNSFAGHNPFDLHFGLGDAAMAEEVTIRFPSGVEQTLTNVASGQRLTVIEDVSTAIAVSVVSAEAAPHGRSRIVWQIGEPDGGSMTIVRRTESTPWQRIAEAPVDGLGRVTFEDLEAAGTERRGYAIEIASNGTTSRLGEVWLAASGAAAAALEWLGGNPARGRLRAAITLPHDADARVEMFEAGGRRVASHDLTRLAAGRHEIDLGAGGALRPGVYWLRVTSGSTSESVRVAVVR